MDLLGNLKDWVKSHPPLANAYRKAYRKTKKWERSVLRSRARRALLRRLPKEAVCVEVGVWAGDFSTEILRVCRPRRLVLVDAWEFMPEFPRAWYGGGIADGQAFMDGLFKSVVDRFANVESVELVRALSVSAAQTLSDQSLDWVYLDSNHSYEAVAADLRAWLPKVRSGGVFAGDDYHETGAWFKDGVKRAVDEVVEEGQAKLEWLQGEQFLLRVP